PPRFASDGLQQFAHRRRRWSGQDQAERLRPNQRADVERRTRHRHAVGTLRLLRPQRRRMVRRLISTATGRARERYQRLNVEWPDSDRQRITYDRTCIPFVDGQWDLSTGYVDLRRHFRRRTLSGLARLRREPDRPGAKIVSRRARRA